VFIDLSPQDAGTPINAVVAGNEIWVTDQLRDKVTRWSLDGTSYIGAITGGMNNIRGLEIVGDTGYLCNAQNSSAPPESIITIDVPTATITGDFPAGSEGSGDPFDVLFVPGEGRLLVNDIDDDDIDWFTLAGVFDGEFHNSDGSTGINFPEQMNLSNTGTILAGGFSTPSGVYEYDLAGNQLNYWAVGGIRGVWPLGNGNIMFTDGQGVHSLDPATGGVTDLYTGVSARFIEFIPEPTSLALLALGGVAVFLRRR
jgi:hypothetical protein